MAQVRVVVPDCCVFAGASAVYVCAASSTARRNTRLGRLSHRCVKHVWPRAQEAVFLAMDLNAQLVRLFACTEFWEGVQTWATDSFNELDTKGRRIVKEVRT